jgi:hypothetical protein
MSGIETELHGARDLIDVLSARTSRKDEAFLQFALVDENVFGNPDLRHSRFAGTTGVPPPNLK